MNIANMPIGHRGPSGKSCKKTTAKMIMQNGGA